MDVKADPLGGYKNYLWTPQTPLQSVGAVAAVCLIGTALLGLALARLLTGRATLNFFAARREYTRRCELGRRYDGLREAYDEYKYHAGWARSQGDTAEAERLTAEANTAYAELRKLIRELQGFGEFADFDKKDD